MFRGGQARRILRGVDQPGNMEEHGRGSFFHANAVTVFDSAFAQSARQADHASECSHARLLVFMKSSEGTAICRFRTAMVTDGPSQQLPFLAGPGGRYWPLQQKLARRFLGRLARTLQA